MLSEIASDGVFEGQNIDPGDQSCLNCGSGPILEGTFAPEKIMGQASLATEFKTVNNVSCRIDEDGNLDLANGEVFKFAGGEMDHYDIDGGLIQSRSAGDPVYEEWKARYDELIKLDEED